MKKELINFMDFTLGSFKFKEEFMTWFKSLETNEESACIEELIKLNKDVVNKANKVLSDEIKKDKRLHYKLEQSRNIDLYMIYTLCADYLLNNYDNAPKTIKDYIPEIIKNFNKKLGDYINKVEDNNNFYI